VRVLWTGQLDIQGLIHQSIEPEMKKGMQLHFSTQLIYLPLYKAIQILKEETEQILSDDIKKCLANVSCHKRENIWKIYCSKWLMHKIDDERKKEKEMTIQRR
ncbi:hypothetical protein ACJX0J_041397, partial [Zea mays]